MDPLLVGCVTEILCWGFGSVIQALYIFFSFYPSIAAPSLPVFSPASYTLLDSFGLKHQLRSDLSCVIFDIVSDPYSVSVSGGLDAVFFTTPHALLLTPFISVCVPSFCLSSCTVKGSLSS